MPNTFAGMLTATMLCDLFVGAVEVTEVVLGGGNGDLYANWFYGRLVANHGLPPVPPGRNRLAHWRLYRTYIIDLLRRMARRRRRGRPAVVGPNVYRDHLRELRSQLRADVRLRG
ncbi:hypothetical protein DFP72DRAFT_849680 [Ephemerocybe angulata]|uniref:Uncharacterized protein n=1 Tax=Ephemerocybe angulata TaxID=980116 RepID=A0A8H6HU86_9AGAR|nr:hypothetical protein DFP72DRAFT_849680 [Tulosesus angulatus]